MPLTEFLSLLLAMAPLWIVLTTLSLTPLVKGALLTSQINSSVTTETLLEKYGYPYEEHEVTTEDGYILTMHRIPNAGQTSPHRIAFLMHGLSASSSDYVIAGNESLGIRLFEEGFDVWMGNARGNLYSDRNVKFSNNSLEFWNFSFHEISIYDLPAMMNYIRDFTGVQQVRYFGHSQGTTNYLVLTSVYPEWNDRIIAAHLLAPVGFMSHLRNTYFHILGPLVGNPNALKEVIGSMKLDLSKETVQILSKLLCNGSITEPYRILCENSLFLLTEFNDDTANEALIPDLMATTPQAVSVNQYIHYLQEFQSGYFRQYDFGPRNLIQYGSASPPNYKLKNIKGPIYMYFGLGDEYVAKTDLDKLIRRLPNNTVAGVYTVPIPNFDHLAFLYTKNIGEKLYNKVLNDVAASME